MYADIAAWLDSVRAADAAVADGGAGAARAAQAIAARGSFDDDGEGEEDFTAERAAAAAVGGFRATGGYDSYNIL